MPSEDDIYKARRRMNLLLASVFLAVNLLVLVALLPAVLDTFSASISVLPDLSPETKRFPPLVEASLP